MAVKGIKRLFSKDYIVYLILLIWLITGVTFFYFKLRSIGTFIFIPLLGICLVFFLATYVLRADLKKLSLINILKITIIIVVLTVLFIFFNILFAMTLAILFAISIISYILITAIFSMYTCYEYGIKLDNKMYEVPKFVGFFLRWGIFLGGTVFAIFLIMFVHTLGLDFISNEGLSGPILTFLSFIPLILGGEIIVLALIGGLSVIIGRLNGWLGIFLIFVSIYSSYLMVNALLSVGDPNIGTNILSISSIYSEMARYVFDIFLIIGTILIIIGKRLDILKKEFKYIKPDAILIWLIFSKAAYEFADAVLYNFPPIFINGFPIVFNVSVWKSIGVFVLFIPLLFSFGYYGIIQYGRIKQDRKRKIRIKRLRKEGVPIDEPSHLAENLKKTEKI